MPPTFNHAHTGRRSCEPSLSSPSLLAHYFQLCIVWLKHKWRPDAAPVLQAAMFWDVPHHSADIKRMELAVLSALEWRTWAVTVANLLDPLIFSLDLLEPAPAAESSYEKLYILRESCKLILAKTLRGVLRSLATA